MRRRVGRDHVNVPSLNNKLKIFFVCIFKAIEEKSRIRIRNRILIVRICGSGSESKRHGSGTLFCYQFFSSTPGFEFYKKRYTLHITTSADSFATQICSVVDPECFPLIPDPILFHPGSWFEKISEPGSGSATLQIWV